MSDTVDSRAVWDNGGRWCAWLLLLLAVAPYAQVRNYPHVHDDHMLRGPGSVAAETDVPLSELLAADFFGTRERPTGQTGFWRPLVLLSFRVEALLSGGSEAGYAWLGHVFTLLCHAAASLALWRLLTAVGLGPAAALLGAAWFAVHPVHVESVAWASGRTDSLPTALGFMALTLQLRQQASRAALWGAALLLAAALLCKETALLLVLLGPVLLLSQGRRPARALGPALGALLAVLLLRAAVFGLLPGADPAAYTGPADAWTRWATWGSILPRLLRFLLWPGPATPLHPVEPVTSIVSSEALLGGAVLALIGLGAWLAWRRRSLPGLLAAGLVGGTLMMLAPWTAVPTGYPEVAAPLYERYLYAAAAAPGLLLGAALRGREREPAGRRDLILGLAGALLLGLAWGPVTASRCRMWSSDVAFAQAGLAMAPEATSLWVHLGTAQLERYRAGGERESGEAALAALERALALDPGHQLARVDRLIARAMLGQLEAAAADAQRLLQLFPDDPGVLHNVAAFFAGVGDHRRAAELYQRELATGRALPGAEQALSDSLAAVRR